MHESTLAIRYVNALGDLAAAAGMADAVGQDLESFSAMISSTPGLADLLTSPTTRSDRLHGVIDTFAHHAALQPLTAKFLHFLAERRRMALFPFILRAYRRDLDRRANRLEIKVASAAPLTDAQSQGLQATLGDMTGHSVVLKTETRPELLGGIAVRMGSLLLDYSVQSRMNRLKAQLTGH
ncbi:MAG: ATP synthase F1 subunit delta [Magnetococcus sp. WYHC-3]